MKPETRRTAAAKRCLNTSDLRNLVGGTPRLETISDDLPVLLVDTNTRRVSDAEEWMSPVNLTFVMGAREQKGLTSHIGC